MIDWSTSRPVAGALVVASLLPDSLPYRGVADSSGHFSLGPLPQGDYLVNGVLDQDTDHRQGPREAYGSARVARGKSAVGELWAFVHDTSTARIQTVAVDDSVKASITFSQKLDPRQRLSPRDVSLRLLPDSTPVTVSSILPQPVDDSIHGTRTPAEDSTGVEDSTGADTSRGGAARCPRAAWPSRRGSSAITAASVRSPGPEGPQAVGSRLADGARSPGGTQHHRRHRHRGGRGRCSGEAKGRAEGQRQGGADPKQPEARPAARQPQASAAGRQPPPHQPEAQRSRFSEEEAVTDPRRQLPSVDRLLHQPAVQELLRHAPRGAVIAAVRESLDAARTRRAGPPEEWEDDIRERLVRRTGSELRPVLNATGVVLHTNLGRAPLAEAAIQAMLAIAGGYSNLELDLSTGIRGTRSDHCRALLRSVTGAEDALVVNNAAGALILALNALADGRDVLISRGELIEIGGSFRIPDIMAKSGARLREVGTTNRTHLEDYRRALNSDVGAILTVHRSNFELRGFVASPQPEKLAELAAGAGIPYLYDIGSGLIPDLSPWGLTGEPRVAEALGASAGLVLFSGDKLLGGPQAGCLVGSRELVARCRENPIARAMRADKLTLAALAATLGLYQDEEAVRLVPVLAMLTLGPEELGRRAQRLAAACPATVRAQTMAGESAVGGGSFPGAVLATTLVALDAGSLGADGLALRLRLGQPSIVARVASGRLVIDPRTLPEDSFPVVAAAIEQALGS